MEAVCTAKEFKDLTNPYTGEPMVVLLITTKSGQVKFTSRDTYSPVDVCGSAEEAFRKWNRSGGVEGGKEGKPVVCAYTGHPLSLRKDEDGFRYEGGFNPHLLYNRNDFLHFAAMRGGKSKYPRKKEDGMRVEAVREKPIVERKANTTELSDEAVDMAAKVIQDFKGVNGIGTEAPVSMSVPSGGKGSRRGRGK